MVHAFNDGLDGRASLHALVGGQVADVAGTHGENFLAQQGVFLVHHLLEHGGGVNARHIVVLKGWHEGHGTRGYYEMFSVHIANFLCDDVLQGDALAFQEVPNGVVQEDAFVVVASQCLGDVEATHAAELLLLLEEEELVGLHVELTADVGVIVDDHIRDAELVEFLTAGQTCRTCADDGDGGLVDLHLALWVLGRLGLVALGNLADFLHTVDFGDADTADFAVDQHLASAAFTDAAFQ